MIDSVCRPLFAYAGQNQLLLATQTLRARPETTAVTLAGKCVRQVGDSQAAANQFCHVPRTHSPDGDGGHQEPRDKQQT